MATQVKIIYNSLSIYIFSPKSKINKQIDEAK